jgi:hypothetical protein
MSASLADLHVDGLKYVVGRPTAEFTASENGRHGFARNAVSFGGEVFPVTGMNLRADGRSGGYSLRGSFVVPRSLRQIFPQMGLVSAAKDDKLAPCDNLLAVAFESQPCLCRLEARAFCKCSGLRSISVPSSVRRIGLGCFWGCTDSDGAWVEGGSLEEVGISAFKKCMKLCCLGLRAETPLYAIPERLCWQCDLRWVLIPESVAAIKKRAFQAVFRFPG